MNWDDLRFFLAVARAGTLQAAARQLGVDHTTVSRRIKALEAGLGQALFARHLAGHELSPAGLALLPKAEAMEQAALAVLQPANQPADAPHELSGVVRVGATEGFGAAILAPALAQLGQAHPRLTVDLLAVPRAVHLSKREADVAIAVSPPESGRLVVQRLCDYHLHLAAHQDYLVAHPALDSLSDLRAHRLIGYIPDLLYAPELRYLDEIHPGLAATIRSSSINAQQRLLAQGAGIGVLPCFIGDADPALRPVLPGQRIMRSFWIVTHKDTHNLARVRAGTKWLVEAAARHRALMLPD